MAWVYAFWAVAALAIVGLIADVFGLVKHAGRRFAVTAVVLKVLTALAFGGWFIALESGTFIRLGDWSDLATLALLMLLALAALAAALVCDVVVLVKLGSAGGAAGPTHARGARARRSSSMRSRI